MRVFESLQSPKRLKEEVYEQSLLSDENSIRLGYLVDAGILSGDQVIQIIFEVSFDGGATFQTRAIAERDFTLPDVSKEPIVPGDYIHATYSKPRGATHVRARISSSKPVNTKGRLELL